MIVILIAPKQNKFGNDAANCTGSTEELYQALLLILWSVGIIERTRFFNHQILIPITSYDLQRSQNILISSIKILERLYGLKVCTTHPGLIRG
ncbi:uncharacterized protein LOC110665448 isoform X2 [Hevea brasiliensis]|uniref:uncharacterized protein LOC110665448 isoform X2 n=1 Tax=Hevea brasiliensis TaxID=3981 RepID=UPI0025D8A9AF|nr:uncharacterized protein LOC110665448 isoform X2 [Hevea brasiliensis]